MTMNYGQGKMEILSDSFTVHFYAKVLLIKWSNKRAYFYFI